MLLPRQGGKGALRLLLSVLLLAAWKTGSGQVHYSVAEEAKHGTFVGRIAQDLGLELAELVPRLFRVASKGHGDLLEVNLQNGILFVNSRIDREELCGRSAECSIHLEVIVDRPLQVFHVVVEVKDINDNPPVFRAREQRLFIPESRLVDSLFPIEGAADEDIGTNALLTYTLSPSDYFSLDVQASDELSKSLSLELRKSLDREETPELHLLLTATDGGKPELEGTVQLLITVLDVNDNTPLFAQAVYRVHLLESTANGTLVTTLNASDADEGVNGEIVFSFGSDVPLNIQKNFKIDSNSGEIRLIGRLDYEETKSYEIQVKAVDKGNPPMSNHCKVLVKVLDVNDNAPQLAITPLSLPVREDTPLGTVIAFVSVSDRDSGVSGQVTCSLMPHIPFKLVSTFKNYYSLVLDSALDRESVADYALVVTARDAGSPSLSATASVSVEVADVNDNAPAFAQPEYTVFDMQFGSRQERHSIWKRLARVFSRREEGPGARRLLFSLLLLSVWETGSGQVHYSVLEEAKHGTFVGRIAQDLGLELAELVPRLFRVASKGHGDLLEVNLQNGILFVNSRIDREELCGRSADAECSIHLEVIVDRPLQVFHVEVEVKDINDNQPVFPVAVKKLFIYESRPPGSRIPLEGASDADIGANSLLTYSLNSNDYFTLDIKRNDDNIKSLGLVLRKVLDREDTPEHHLLVTAVDGGKPELTGTTQVKITILDVNDNAPEFERTVYRVSLFENAPNGTLAVIVNASDLDEGVNKDIVYSFNTDMSADTLLKFHLDPVSGYISVKGNIDFEETKLYEIQVDATDKGTPPMTGHCTVLVEILDTNDNVPELVIKSLSLPVLEDAPLGTVIALISVSDRDSGANGQVTCTLSPRVPFKLVSTFKNYYSLVIGKSLDREEAPEIFLVLTATDGGKPELTGTVQLLIKVLDANDNAPAFDRTLYAVKLPENVPNGTSVMKLNASDLDEGSNADIIYSFSTDILPNVESKFHIDPLTGEIMVKGYIDFEESKSYEILVEGIDKGQPPLSGHCTVMVEVEDTNDNVPVMEFKSLSLPIREDAPLGTVIALISVYDLDSGANGQVTCTLSPRVPFKLVSTFKNYYSLTFENCNEFAMVYSQRRSPGSRRLLLSLLLLAVWEAGSGQVHYSVPEEVKHGTFVGRIAQDLGLEQAELVPRLFRVASKGHRDLLEVNLQNGILFVNSRIDREELCGRSLECSIHLEVIVDRPLQVFHVEVEVKDINDNPPRFFRQEQRLFILESRIVDSRFPLEGASDMDVGANAELRYKLNPNEYFDLDVKANDEETNILELVLKKAVDREEIQEHLLLLTAIDGGKPELTGTVQLLINVLDANDNAPKFDKSVYNIRLLENAPNGTLVIKLNASDADDGINKEIVYLFSDLVLDNVKSKFIIDSNNGEITVKGELDYEDCNLYEINIDAVDRSPFPLTGHCKVIVKLLDENDNTPEMVITSISLPVQEDASVGTVIALISLSDRDSGLNGQVTCTLSPRVPFKLVSTFKNYYSLVLDSALDRESVADYALVVTARDAGSPSLSATASMSVEVADVNDNAPAFAQPEYTVFVKENNPPGCHIFTVSARDADAQENALVSYSLVERRVGERALSSYVSVHAESGKVYALHRMMSLSTMKSI
ncbi:protocadherin Fat 4 [Leptonychotes weddellii]|uniref:Protocadherin Fat 4 n=1 Tax=Leptonychotes weddellii TaxID=9713 RepID=A0A7F8QMK9_LEPWE|nr:protocadherin Fat 4 [Leptonychotes weddellii]